MVYAKVYDTIPNDSEYDDDPWTMLVEQSTFTTKKCYSLIFDRCSKNYSLSPHKLGASMNIVKIYLYVYALSE